MSFQHHQPTTKNFPDVFDVVTRLQTHGQTKAFIEGTSIPVLRVGIGSIPPPNNRALTAHG